MGAEEKEEECPACDGIGYGLEGDGEETMTQGFIHGMRMRQESSGVKTFFEKLFRVGKRADFAGVFALVQVLTGRGKGQGEAGEKGEAKSGHGFHFAAQSERETGSMGKSKKPVSCRDGLESNCKRFAIVASNVANESKP